MKLYVVKNVGKKSGKEYTALCIDLGYRETLISFDNQLVAEISGMTFADLHALKVGDKIHIADVKQVNK